MARQIASFTHHHDNERAPWRQFVESEAEALSAALEGEFGYDLSVSECEDLLATAKKEGEATHAEEGTFTVWWEPAEKAILGKTTEPNFGVGEGESVAQTDKRSNVWIAFEDYTVLQSRRDELEKMDKVQLVNLILEMEALR